MKYRILEFSLASHPEKLAFKVACKEDLSLYRLGIYASLLLHAKEDLPFFFPCNRKEYVDQGWLDDEIYNIRPVDYTKADVKMLIEENEEHAFIYGEKDHFAFALKNKGLKDLDETGELILLAKKGYGIFPEKKEAFLMLLEEPSKQKKAKEALALEEDFDFAKPVDTIAVNESLPSLFSEEKKKRKEVHRWAEEEDYKPLSDE